MGVTIDLYKKLPKESFELFIRNLSVRDYLEGIWRLYEINRKLDYLKEFDGIFEELFRFFFRPFELLMFNERMIRNIIPIQEIFAQRDVVSAYTDFLESVISHMKLTFQLFSEPVYPQKLPVEKFFEDWRNLLRKFETSGEILMHDYPFALPENAKNYLLDCFTHWKEFVECYEIYKKLIRDAYRRAVDRLLNMANSTGFQSFERFRDVFQDCLAKEFDILLKSEEYLEVQGRLMNTLFDHIYCLRRFLELMIENNPASPFATVSQIDEAYKRILDLKRKVLELEKRIEKLEGERCSKK
ncbi:MAG: poly(R)-hydroxyalkanoic acid synthase subunit PhaE [Archaeoglobaceae archaeon]